MLFLVRILTFLYLRYYISHKRSPIFCQYFIFNIFNPSINYILIFAIKTRSGIFLFSDQIFQCVDDIINAGIWQ